MKRNYYNRTKYQILKLLKDNYKYYTPREISEETGLTLHAAEERLYRLTLYNYIWRKKETRNGNSNRFCYKRLKQKGKRILDLLEERVELEERTGIPVTLNLKKRAQKIIIPEPNIEKKTYIHTFITSQ